MTFVWIYLLLLGYAFELGLCKDDAGKDAGKIFDVAIIGAGWAGIGAASHIAQNSNASILILESTNRTGGRVEAASLGDSNIIVELGAMWMPGTLRHKDYGESILSQLARENDLAAIEVDELKDLSFIPFIDMDGNDADPKGILRRSLVTAIKCVYDAFEEKLYRTLSDCGWVAKTKKAKAFERGMLECRGGMDTNEELTENIWGNERLVVEQHQRGFNRILDVFLQTLPNSPIAFNSRVEQIEYSGNIVNLTTKTKTFKARHAISTLPLGVLKKHHSVMFSPPLSEDLKIELEEAEMIQEAKIYLQFERVWWDDALVGWIANDRDLPNWRNMNHPTVIPGSKTLLAFALDESATKVEAMDDSQVVAFSMDILRKQFPNVTVLDPTNATETVSTCGP
ncbi:hypothetical protein ACHAWF_015789 [Thalassiosira exigua]